MKLTDEQIFNLGVLAGSAVKDGRMDLATAASAVVDAYQQLLPIAKTLAAIDPVIRSDSYNGWYCEICHATLDLEDVDIEAPASVFVEMERRTREAFKHDDSCAWLLAHQYVTS